MSFGLFKNNLRNKIIFISGLALGVLASIILFVIKVSYPKETNIAIIEFNRKILVFVAVVLFFAFIFSIFDLLSKNKWIKTTYRFLLSISFLSVVIYIFPQVYQYTREFVYFGEETISTMSILRFVGFMFGIILSLIIGLSANKVYLAIDEKTSRILTIISIFVFDVDYIFKAISALARLKVIKAKGLIFEIMIIEDNYHKHFIYALLLVGLVALIIAIKQNIKVKGEFKNNALRRKARANIRTKRRWSYSLLVTIFLAVFTLTVLHYYDTKEVELAEPQSYTVKDDKIIIDLEDVNDGKLHRFSYVTPNGYDVRFLVVKKPQGESYGLGLDACEICGIAGYFERGEDVVCKRCDVVMNKATIGFKGGCNPIPFPYVIENAQIIIEKRVLEAEERRFK